MVEAFVYMYFVGLGTSLGIATVVWIGWKVYNREKSKNNKRKGAIAR
ncbi:hypothetical protein [Niallia circulans]|nr:hypothetical protein [Niallia circulans]